MRLQQLDQVAPGRCEWVMSAGVASPRRHDNKVSVCEGWRDPFFVIARPSYRSWTRLPRNLSLFSSILSP